MELLVEADIPCPHCGETFPLLVDTSLANQALVEDCSVCCRPIQLRVESELGEVISVDVRT